jgi:uncharacterized protein (UPF0276 family)
MTRMPQLTIPKAAGIGLRSPHVAEMLSRRPSAGWLEVHAENYMGNSAQVAALETLRQTYPLSVHGVGLSLGSAGGLDADHLKRLARVVSRFEPDLVSEHLAWSVADGAYLNDLLPLRYDEAALAIVAGNVEHLQDTLKRPVLIENLSAYVEFSDSTMTEAEFLAHLVKRTGCGLLLDVNNVYVSAHNLGFDAARFIDTLPSDAIGEIHLAGHAVNELGDDTVLIDDHGSRVPPAVWSLYAGAIDKFGPRPTLIEWDTALPSLDVLLGEAMWADMLAAAIGFRRRATEAPARQQPAIVLPFEPRSPQRGMKVLAAFDTLKANGLAEAYQPRRTSHAHA